MAKATVIPKIDVERFLASATPEQLAKIRTLAAVEGVTGIEGGLRKNADDSTTVEIRIAPEIMEQIKEFEAAGGTLHERVQFFVTQALEAYMYADWRSMVQPAPAPVAAAAAAAAAAVPVAGGGGAPAAVK